jgi:peptidoglycan hydrolase CwlO-like protein
MTQEELFEDLKQFVTSTVSQSEERIMTHVDKLDGRIDTLSARIDSLSERIDSVDEKLDIIQEAIAESIVQQEAILKDHEHRITRLEHREARS